MTKESIKMQKISRESAEEQMATLLDFYEIETSDIVNEHGKDALDTIHNRLVSSIEKGRLEIRMEDNEIQVIQHLKHPPGEITEITYGSITAAAKLAMDGIGENKGYAKVHALMGALSKLGPKAMKELRGADQGIMERLALVFQVV
jgi:hypothetical protein